MERYLFDPNGSLVLKGALSQDELAACNATDDEVQAFAAAQGQGTCWFGTVRVSDHGRQEGISLLLRRSIVWPHKPPQTSDNA